MLRNINQIQNNYLFDACQLLDNAMYLSSYLLVHNAESRINEIPLNGKIASQGPSLERWDPFMDTSGPGMDHVLSIHCPFWPESATEWISRPRKFAWPSPSAIKSVVDFGFHLVPTIIRNVTTSLRVSVLVPAKLVYLILLFLSI